MKDENSKREQLIVATMQLLQKKDANQVSIREIAQVAGQNSATISYYFGGKEALIQLAMERHREGLLKIFTSVFEAEKITRERVEQFARELMTYLITYEGVYRTGRQQEMDRAKAGGPSCDQDFTSTQLKAICYMIHSLRPELAEDQIMIKAIQFFSSLAYPTIYADMFTHLEQGLSFEDFLSQYVKSVVDTLLVKE